MLLQGLFSWWYDDGYKDFMKKMIVKLGDTIDFFSISSLLKTLFAPYRQISANASGESIDAKMAAFVDRFVSRLVGSVARLGIIIVGILALILQFISTIIMFILWPLLPLVPFACIILCISGVAIWIH